MRVGERAWERWRQSGGADAFTSSFTNAKSRPKPLSIIYLKINANEVLSRQWPSFTIKSDLFRKDLRCRFPSNGGAAAVTLQHGIQFVTHSGALTRFALIRAAWGETEGPHPHQVPQGSAASEPRGISRVPSAGWLMSYLNLFAHGPVFLTVAIPQRIPTAPQLTLHLSSSITSLYFLPPFPILHSCASGCLGSFFSSLISAFCSPSSHVFLPWHFSSLSRFPQAAGAEQESVSSYRALGKVLLKFMRL